MVQGFGSVGKNAEHVANAIVRRAVEADRRGGNAAGLLPAAVGSLEVLVGELLTKVVAGAEVIDGVGLIINGLVEAATKSQLEAANAGRNLDRNSETLIRNGATATERSIFNSVYCPAVAIGDSSDRSGDEGAPIKAGRENCSITSIDNKVFRIPAIEAE